VNQKTHQMRRVSCSKKVSCYHWSSKGDKTGASSIPSPNFGLVKRGNVGRYIFCLIS
jgi:hypothetical protein